MKRKKCDNIGNSNNKNYNAKKTVEMHRKLIKHEVVATYIT